MNTPRSSIPEFVWPGIPSVAGCILMGLQFQLERSQWLSAQAIRELQFLQIERLLGHAYRTVPYYTEMFNAASVQATESLTPETWLQVPLLTRESLQERTDDLLSTAIPKEHGQTFQKKTSGSTGRQIKITNTEGNRLFWQANTLRDHLWHERDFSGRLAAIRSGRYEKNPVLVTDNQSWAARRDKFTRQDRRPCFSNGCRSRNRRRCCELAIRTIC